jgi:hypothetical protein
MKANVNLDSGDGLSPVGVRPLTRFAREIGKTMATVWRWRKQGMLETLNVCGKIYVTDEQICRFKERAAAGEFAREPVGAARRKQEQEAA